jgi:hypothetical protein
MAAAGRRPGQLSLLEDMGESSSNCGYCHQPGCTSVSRGACVHAHASKHLCARAHAVSRGGAGMWAHRLLVDDYQGARRARHAAQPQRLKCMSARVPVSEASLISVSSVCAALRLAELVDRGWRRSGCWLYKVRTRTRTSRTSRCCHPTLTTLCYKRFCVLPASLAARSRTWSARAARSTPSASRRRVSSRRASTAACSAAWQCFSQET